MTAAVEDMAASVSHSTRGTVAAPKLCTRDCGRPRRSVGQRYCRVCHAAANKAHRDRKRLSARAMAWELNALKTRQTLGGIE